MNNYLRWFRDQGRGQEAADALGAVQEQDGSWPIAKLEVSREGQDGAWRHLLDTYGVNAMFYQHIPGDPEPMMCNPDGTRSVFDDVDK